MSASFFVSKLLDVFSSKTNLNLVLEFLDTDLEMIIKDRSLVFLPADIKSWMAMTFRGLEFCHRNFILHRVRTILSLHASRSPHGDGDQSYFFAYRPTDHLYHVSISHFHFYYYYFLTPLPRFDQTDRPPQRFILPKTGSETEQLTHRLGRSAQDRRLWLGP